MIHRIALLNNNELYYKNRVLFCLEKRCFGGHRVKDPELDKIKRETFYFRWQELPRRMTFSTRHRPANQTDVLCCHNKSEPDQSFQFGNLPIDFYSFLPFIYFGEFSAGQKKLPHACRYSDTEINRSLSA